MRTPTSLVALATATCLLGLSSEAVADTCYAVEGKVETINVSPTTQVGKIRLILSDSGGQQVFDNKGQLVGRITGAEIDGPLLSHVAAFPASGSGFITDGDKAKFGAVRNTDDQGIPCSFNITEDITRFANGSGFFSNVSSVAVTANGYISFCPLDNENKFQLSGELCVK